MKSRVGLNGGGSGTSPWTGHGLGCGADEGDGAALREEALAGGERARAAFEQLWRLYYRRLLAFAATWRGLPGPEREDAVAESLIAAFVSLECYDPARPLAPWLYRLAANRFSDAARRAARTSRLMPGEGMGGALAFDPPDSRPVEEGVAERDLVERCGRAIGELSDVDRRIAVLRFYEGLGSAEIGRILGMPAGTVRWRVARIRGAVVAKVGGFP